MEVDKAVYSQTWLLRKQLFYFNYKNSNLHVN